MSQLFNILAHHPETVDPTLVEWIRHRIDALTGLDPGVIVLLLGVLIVAFPLGLFGVVWFHRRRVDRKG